MSPRKVRASWFPILSMKTTTSCILAKGMSASHRCWSVGKWTKTTSGKRIFPSALMCLQTKWCWFPSNRLLISIGLGKTGRKSLKPLRSLRPQLSHNNPCKRMPSWISTLRQATSLIASPIPRMPQNAIMWRCWCLCICMISTISRFRRKSPLSQRSRVPCRFCNSMKVSWWPPRPWKSKEWSWIWRSLMWPKMWLRPKGHCRKSRIRIWI